jgi:hypothetical protein
MGSTDHLARMGTDESWASAYSPEVHQAAGMIAAQANCPIEHAISKMWDRADADNASIDDIATAVLNRSIRFTDGN